MIVKGGITMSENNKQAEEQEVQQRSSPSGKIVYKAILKEGEE